MLYIRISRENTASKGMNTCGGYPLIRKVFVQTEGKIFNDFNCYSQSCNGQETGMCGSSKLELLFSDLSNCVGEKNVEYFQHIEIVYSISDTKKVRGNLFL